MTEPNRNAHCPWLGSRDDPATHFAFPNLENLCGAPNGPPALALAHQARWCLSGSHSACQFYCAPDSVLPPNPESLRSIALSRRTVLLTALGIVVLFLTAVVLVLRPSPIQTEPANEMPTSAPSAMPTMLVAKTVPVATQGAGVSPTLAASRTVPVALSSATVPATPTPCIYVVQSGDTLSQIAARFRVTVAALVAANNLQDPGKIRTGMRLVIPLGSSAVTPAVGISTPTARP